MFLFSFSLPFVDQQYIRPYVESIVHMEIEHVFDIAKDAGGRRVIEAFLSSDASSKQKRKIIAKYVSPAN